MDVRTEDPAEPVDLFAPELSADPYGGYARIRERAPVLVGSMLDGPPSWLVTRHADVRSVLTDPRFANDARSVPGGDDPGGDPLRTLGLDDELVAYFEGNILHADGAAHTRLRTLVARAFTARRVSALRPRLEEITTTLLDRVADAGRDGRRVELVGTFCHPLAITVICELVGIDADERDQWHEWAEVLSTMDPERISATMRAFVDHMSEVVARRRAAPRDDLISALLAAREDDGDRLTDRETITLVLVLVLAGHDTTANLLGNAVLSLLAHPGQLATLRADPDRWPRAVDELMRLRAPIHFANVRYPVTDVELGGVRIPAGAPVVPLLLSANTDPREFDDPAALDVTRGSGRRETHLSFGRGPHYCLGAALARQEAEVALRGLFERFPDLATAVPASEIAWVPRPGFTRVAELPVRTG